MDNTTRTYSFAEALITPEHVVCSVSLRPFSLGHWTFLDQCESPLLSAELYPEEVSSDPNENYKNCIRHILLFVIICAHTFEDCKRMVDDAKFFEETKALIEANMCKYIKNTASWNIFIEVNKVREYLNYYIKSMPEFVEKGPPTPPSGIDWMQNLYAVMKNEYGYSESQIMNMSMRRMYSEWVTFAAKNGAVEVKTQLQINSERQAAEYVEKVKSGEIKLEQAAQ
jgi:hypothetical protein